MKRNIIIIKKLRKQRYTYREIGEKLGLSKQRIHQIYKNYNINSYAGVMAVKNFGKKNLLCSVCGSGKRLETHHKDGNRKNNNFSNLQRLCMNCHKNKEGFLYKTGLKKKDKCRQRCH